jgi:MFS family permease
MALREGIMAHSSQDQLMAMHGHHAGTLERTLLIGLIAFLTVVDLFGTQAILPALVRNYGVTPAAMGLAVNATTMGMAVSCLGVAYFSHRIDRRRGILVSLTVLTIPTALLSVAPDLATFTVLRIIQGLCMASAFTLTLAYLGEHCSAMDAGGAFAAYITGNVASNLFGRLLAAGLADHLGLPATFLSLAGLNLLGAVIVYVWLTQSASMMPQHEPGRSPLSVWAEHLKNPLLRSSFAIGFCILFAFIGTFTYVNFGRCHVNPHRAHRGKFSRMTVSSGDIRRDSPRCHGVDAVKVGSAGRAARAGWNEKVTDGREHVDEPLQTSGRSKALPRPFSPAEREMRILR